jgi:chemotaxis protein MotD
VARKGATGQETAFGRLMNAAAETEGRKAGSRGSKGEAADALAGHAASALRGGKPDPRAALAADAKVEDAAGEHAPAEAAVEETKDADPLALLMAALVIADAPVAATTKAATADGPTPGDEPAIAEDADAPGADRAARGRLATLLAGPVTPHRTEQAQSGEGGEVQAAPETPRGATGAAAQPDAAMREDASPASAQASKRESSQPDAKMTVVSVQTAPAPAPVAPAAISATGTALVASIEADGTLTRYVTETAAAPAGDAKPMTTLKLQLHPAELGNVTVKISGTGDEIAIEVQVENTEARQRLASDSDAIVKSLRGLGYDIERVSVQQIAPASNAGQQQTATGGGRGDGFAAFEQRGGERGQNQQGNANPGGRENGQERVASQAQADRGSAAGTVYI